ncbi:DNA-binding protein [Flavobacterium branchiophilum]|uniref:Putative histone-like DNA-binding protein n=1 Tax=Flavobacterium branchiophilum TaxID=55197 RepID=A0A543G3X3_9FLAO|nr:DNA-binding protein [Flavobacterium branchiophilum]OXA82167.1 DNA-binding protein [Flavobacterium branchiophilum] [Flavobacterium branchiophilum NBRC 15030 = ATCC 35035]TQM40724.1 putative histone-like DNA-binding protein [Flavobacterium branchiophilum]GEM55541.1 DNA-binding protein [Flavobacterium branchiophilum NBRC 15030 = ATCC 35035]
MSVKFNVVAKKNPQDLTAAPKWYASAVGDGETTLKDLAEYASKTSTVSKADILAVLETTLTKVSIDLSNGKIVKVGEYFTLQMSLSSEGSATEAEVTSSKVKGAKINFRPGKMLKDMIKLATFSKK